MTDTRDSELIEKLRGDDWFAFRKLFDKYGNRLFLFAMKYLKDKEDAEDVLNEVFLKIWEKRQNIRTDSSFQSYLFTIAYNNIRQRFLKKSREEKYIRIFAEDLIFSSVKDEEQIDYLAFVKKFNEVIEMLPPRRRQIFDLRYRQEKKNSEIASVLGVSEQFVKKQLVIARKFVVEMMKGQTDMAGALFLSSIFGIFPD